MRLIILWLAIGCVCCAQDFAAKWKSLSDRARGASGEQLISALREMNELVPGNARILGSLAAALKDNNEATQLKVRLAAAGIGDSSTTSLTQAMEALQLAGEDWIAEDLVNTPSGFLISSVRKGVIFRSDGSTFASPGTSVFGLGLDIERNLVWAALGWTPHCVSCSAGQKGNGALVAYDLKNGALRKRIESIELGDLVVSRKGDVYVTSNSGGNLFVLPNGGKQLQAIGQPGEFPSPQGPTLSRDEKTLYVADYRRGIVAVDLKTKEMTWLKPGPNVIVNGIDGLYAVPGGFVAVQNGVAPVRIVSLTHDLKSQKILESNWTGLGEPTHGIVKGKQFCFLANTGWDAFQDDGTKKPGLGPVVSKIYCRPLP
jgi:hypothetical protein